MPDAGTSQNAQYIVVSATDADNLLKKRIATAGTNVKVADAGAGGNFSISAVTENVALSGVISPSQITSDQNDYSPSGLGTATALRLNTDQRRKITGIAGGTTGRILVLNNVGSYPILLPSEATGSTAANRFDVGNKWLEPDQSLTLIYDGTVSRWTLFGNAHPLQRGLRYSPIFYNDFISTTIDPQPFQKAAIGTGTSSGGSNANITAAHPGWLVCQSAASANTGYTVTTDPAFLGFAGGEVCEFIARFTTITSANYRIGFHDFAGTGAVVDGAWIDMTSTTPVLKTSSNSTVTTSATIATLTTATWYRFLVAVNADATSVTGYIFSDAGALLGSQTNSANIPLASNARATGISFNAYYTPATAVELCWLDWIAFWYEGRLNERG